MNNEFENIYTYIVVHNAVTIETLVRVVSQRVQVHYESRIFLVVSLIVSEIRRICKPRIYEHTCSHLIKARYQYKSTINVILIKNNQNTIDIFT